MFSNKPPEGKDGVIALAVTHSNEAYLASTKLFESNTIAFSTVDLGVLGRDNSVKEYMMLGVIKSDLSGCYIIDTHEVNGKHYMVCVNINYKEFNDFDVYYCDYKPFFVISAQSKHDKSLIYYKNCNTSIEHFKNYNSATFEISYMRLHNK